MKITLRGVSHSFQPMQHSVFSGECCGNLITGVEIQKNAGLLHPVGFLLEPQMSQKTGSTYRDGRGCGVDPNHGSDDQIFLKLGFGRISRPWDSSEADQQHCGQGTPRHVAILLPGRND
jgi:hypothetical protein